jgi:hypothetical protein
VKFKLSAGGELDLLTSGELRDELDRALRNWQQELARGAKFLRRSLSGQVDSGGDLTIRGGEEAGPAEGFVWALTRVTPAAGLLATETLGVYVNDATPSNLLVELPGSAVWPGDHAVILTGGDRLVIAGQALTASARVTVNVQVKEVPYLMSWSL